MKKSAFPLSPDAYVNGLTGWQRTCVDVLRDAVRGAATTEEVIKWGHLVYISNGPVCLLRAEKNRVLLGFWRGQRLDNIEPRLKPGGQYEMATLDFKEGDTLDPKTTRRLVKQAVALNTSLGNPTDAPKKGKSD